MGKEEYRRVGNMKVIAESYDRDLHRELTKMFDDVVPPEIVALEASKRFGQIVLPRS